MLYSLFSYLYIAIFIRCTGVKVYNLWEQGVIWQHLSKAELRWHAAKCTPQWGVELKITVSACIIMFWTRKTLNWWSDVTLITSQVYIEKNPLCRMIITYKSKRYEDEWKFCISLVLHPSCHPCYSFCGSWGTAICTSFTFWIIKASQTRYNYYFTH